MDAANLTGKLHSLPEAPALVALSPKLSLTAPRSSLPIKTKHAVTPFKVHLKKEL